MKLILLSIFLFASFSIYAQSHECQISHNMITPKGDINAKWQVFIKKESGVIKLDGIIHDKKKGESTISREIFFRIEGFSKKGYYFTSLKIRKNPTENISDESLADYYPDFFIYENRRAMFTVNRSGKNFVMSWSTDPMFYCY